MFRIVGNEIYHSRGSTGGFRFKPKLCGTPLTEPFTAVFVLKKSLNDIEETLCKEMRSDGAFIFKREDTLNLKPGDYWYDIEVRVPGQDESITQYQNIGVRKYHLLAANTMRC